MTDTTLSQAIKEAYASAPSDEVILHTLEFRHPTFTTPLRVVRDNVNHNLTLEDDAPVNGGETVIFVGYAFELKPPDVQTQGVPEMLITIDNVTNEIEEALIGASDSIAKVAVTYRAYLLSDTSSPHNNPPLHLTLLSAKMQGLTIIGKATFVDIANKKFPGEDYTATRFPGLITQ